MSRSPPPPPPARLARPVFRAIRRASAVLRDTDRLMLDLAAGFLQAALGPAEREALTLETTSATRSGQQADRLFGWEEAWYDAVLPRPPGRLLVGAAGTGRECEALLARGYAVDAFEPVAAAAAACAARVPAPGRVACASYRELVAAVAGDRGSPAAPFAGTRYDAVILGWGSLSYVTSLEEARALLAAAFALAPHGPVLASCWVRDDGLAATSRAAALGWRVGRLAARVRGRASDTVDGAVLDPRTGLGRRYSRTELETLGADLARRVEWSGGGNGTYPHATFLPRTAGPREAAGD